MTGEALQHTHTFPNHALRGRIREWQEARIERFRAFSCVAERASARCVPPRPGPGTWARTSAIARRGFLMVSGFLNTRNPL